ncbi:hypothetical protein HanRHA438_Chr10g0469031 [Helianthus annuus]|nr:hypothetical protein HanRHA438_Chr10g0469031 [Helianthus annuus]
MWYANCRHFTSEKTNSTCSIIHPPPPSRDPANCWRLIVSTTPSCSHTSTPCTSTIGWFCFIHTRHTITLIFLLQNTLLMRSLHGGRRDGDFFDIQLYMIYRDMLNIK